MLASVAAPSTLILIVALKSPRSSRYRLNLARDAERAHDAVPGLIVANWVEKRW